jgi:hypothetical protein
VIWRWFDSVYEALARGQVDLSAGGTAELSTVLPGDGDTAVPVIEPSLALREVRVVRVGSDTGWVFSDLQWGPDLSVEGIRSVVASAGGRQVAYLPLDRAYDVSNGTFTVVVDQTAVLTLGNRR